MERSHIRATPIRREIQTIMALLNMEPKWQELKALSTYFQFTLSV